MIENGIKLKKKELEMQDTDIAITDNGLKAIFVGGDQKLKPIAEEVLEELRTKAPEIIEQRLNGVHIVNVVTNRERFIQEMVKRGVKLKPPK